MTTQTPSLSDHSTIGTQRCGVAEGGETPDLLAAFDSTVAADVGFLGFAASVLGDLETSRVANENRLRQLVTEFDLDLRHPYVRRMRGVVDQLASAEHQAELGLRALMRAHPLGPWVASQNGLGDKQVARLLAAIGDPYIRPQLTWVAQDALGNEVRETVPARPRTVSELWAYCGLHVHRKNEIHGTAPRHRKGVQSNWSEEARTRVWLVAGSCVKCRTSPFRDVYDQARAKYAESIHRVACHRCGPTGQVGQPLSDGHKHARAVRIVMKEILRALWVESQRLHLDGQI